MLTEYGNVSGLYVHSRGARSFEVRSRGAAAGSFGYRVMARGKPAARQGAMVEGAPSTVVPKEIPVPTAPDLRAIQAPSAERQGRPAAR